MNFDLSQVADLLSKDINVGGAVAGLVALFAGWKATKYVGAKTLGGIGSILGGSFKAANASPAALIIVGSTVAGSAFEGLFGGSINYSMVGFGLSSTIVGIAQYFIKAERGDYQKSNVA